jgi:hypothetical protein
LFSVIAGANLAQLPLILTSRRFMSPISARPCVIAMMISPTILAKGLTSGSGKTGGGIEQPAETISRRLNTNSSHEPYSG